MNKRVTCFTLFMNMFSNVYKKYKIEKHDKDSIAYSK